MSLLAGIGCCLFWAGAELTEYVKKREQEKHELVLAALPKSPPPPEPNLIAGALLYKTLEEVDGRWIGNRQLDRIKYRAQLLEIKNNPIPGKVVGDATDLSA